MRQNERDAHGNFECGKQLEAHRWSGILWWSFQSDALQNLVAFKFCRRRCKRKRAQHPNSRKAQCDAAWAIPSVSVSQKHLAACGYRDWRSRMLAQIETYVCAVWVELPVFCATMQVTTKASGQGAKAREEVEVKGGSPMYLKGRLK